MTISFFCCWNFHIILRNMFMPHACYESIQNIDYVFKWHKSSYFINVGVERIRERVFNSELIKPHLFYNERMRFNLFLVVCKLLCNSLTNRKRNYFTDFLLCIFSCALTSPSKDSFLIKIFSILYVKKFASQKGFFLIFLTFHSNYKSNCAMSIQTAVKILQWES